MELVPPDLPDSHLVNLLEVLANPSQVLGSSEVATMQRALDSLPSNSLRRNERSSRHSATFPHPLLQRTSVEMSRHLLLLVGKLFKALQPNLPLVHSLPDHHSHTLLQLDGKELNQLEASPEHAQLQVMKYFPLLKR